MNGTLIPVGDDADVHDPMRVVPGRGERRRLLRGWGEPKPARSRLRRGKSGPSARRIDVVEFLEQRGVEIDLA